MFGLIVGLTPENEEDLDWCGEDGVDAVRRDWSCDTVDGTGDP